MKPARLPGNPNRMMAPAKINLALHVTGRRPNGYHELHSLTVFAGIGDELQVRAASELSLNVTGPFARDVPSSVENLVLKAAAFLQKRHGVERGAALSLEKRLPAAAGIGGGSADAAATLRLLARLWGLPTPRDTAPDFVELGADVPVCLCEPLPIRMRGIGEQLDAAPILPDLAMVLINPRVAVPTSSAFAALASRENAPLAPLPGNLKFEEFIAWLGQQRNDMLAPALQIAPVIERVLARLRAQSLVRFATMTGSGATCVGLVRHMDEARRVARLVQIIEPGWWVAPAPLLS